MRHPTEPPKIKVFLAFALTGVLMVAGYRIYRIYRMVAVSSLALMNFGSPHPVAAKPAPRPEPSPLPQDTGLYWSDPTKVAQPPAKANTKAQQLKAHALEEAKGDSVRATERLLKDAKDADTSQALFQAMMELALGYPAGPGEGAVPEGGKYDDRHAFKAPEGQSGIAQVAKIAQALADRVGKPEAGPYDSLLLDHAVRLMAFHGVPAKPDGKVLQLADGKGAAPAPDPMVRSALRGLLGNRQTQILAARALGQVGDMETAKEIIENPGKYPDASISDFGPKAVELYKQQQLARLKAGRSTGEGDFWQSMRLPPHHQDTAIELAFAGDGGAYMAMQRNWAVMNLSEKDPDTLFATHIDWAIRFPGTRAGLIGKVRGLDGFFRSPSGNGPKTRAAVLRAMDHDFAIIFGDKPWRVKDLLVERHESEILLGLWHYVRYQDQNLVSKKDMELLAEGTKLLRKYLKPSVKVAPKSPEEGVVHDMSILARHLKLPGITYPGKDLELFRLKREVREVDEKFKTIQAMDTEMKRFYASPSNCYWRNYLGFCVRLGELDHDQDI